MIYAPEYKLVYHLINFCLYYVLIYKKIYTFLKKSNNSFIFHQWCSCSPQSWYILQRTCFNVVKVWVFCVPSILFSFSFVSSNLNCWNALWETSPMQQYVLAESCGFLCDALAWTASSFIDLHYGRRMNRDVCQLLLHLQAFHCSLWVLIYFIEGSAFCLCSHFHWICTS